MYAKAREAVKHIGYHRTITGLKIGLHGLMASDLHLNPTIILDLLEN